MCDPYLSKETASKMVKKLLNVPSIINTVYKVEKMTVQTLAQKIDITERRILNIYNSKIPHYLLAKVSLPLIKLYCKTKFIEE
ncbi:hypothetical protein GAMM_130028 [Gammaproteobacteria bacterium]